MNAHVGLNLIFLVPGETGGMEVAARELVPALLEAAPQIRFTAFINREAAQAKDGPWGELLPAVTVPVNARDRVQWVLGEQMLMPRLAHRHGVDLVHSLASTAPARGRFRRVVTVHDLIYSHYPEAHAGLRAKGMRLLVPLAVRRSHRIVADSQSTADDLVELLGARRELIDVVPLGLGSVRRCEPAAEHAVRGRLELGDRHVVLSLSAKRPHKNLAALIDALALIDVGRRPLLALPGYPTEYEAQLRDHARAAGVADDVRFLGWIENELIEGLWEVAELFVYPSLYEGFGLPVLEAMARGVPVVCSNASSLPEVAGEAALLFDPHDVGSIAVAMERLLGDPVERERLRDLGRRRAELFKWERTARATLDVYRRTLDRSGA